jgi:hypothetical protein
MRDVYIKGFLVCVLYFFLPKLFAPTTLPVFEKRKLGNKTTL